MRSFGETQSKAIIVYTQSEQYHTIMKSRVHLTHESHVKIEINNFNFFISIAWLTHDLG